jgi:hypothetical protein
MSRCMSVDLRSCITALAVGTALAGCVDPAGTFNDFENRIIDANANRSDGSGGIFDVSGEFLLTIRPAFSPNDTLQFLGTIELTETAAGATVDFSFQPLDALRCGGTRVPVGDPLVLQGVEVNQSGAFLSAFEQAIVPPEANGVSCSRIRADVILQGNLKSTDLFCGSVSGEVFAPPGVPALDGSTFAAIRVPAGTIGPDLPDPVVECPPDVVPPDAGPPDGGPPDGGLDGGIA